MTAGNLGIDGWCFVEHVLEQSAHESLRREWPGKHFFEPLRWKAIGKSYDVGLRDNRATGRRDSEIDDVPIIADLYSLLKDDTHAEWLRDLDGRGLDWQCYSLIANVSYSHSFLTPHQDSLGSTTRRHLNLIYFVDASGDGWAGGGTAILRDGTFDAPIFIPKSLCNTALIYRVDADFWHGFPRLPAGAFRHVVTAAFWERT